MASVGLNILQLSKLEFLDEGDEENWLVKDAYGDMYQPASICLISKLPLFEILQVCNIC